MRESNVQFAWREPRSTEGFRLRSLSARPHHAFAGVPLFPAPLPASCSGNLAGGELLRTRPAARRFRARLVDASAHARLRAEPGTRTDRQPGPAPHGFAHRPRRYRSRSDAGSHRRPRRDAGLGRMDRPLRALLLPPRRTQYPAQRGARLDGCHGGVHRRAARRHAARHPGRIRARSRRADRAQSPVLARRGRRRRRSPPRARSPAARVHRLARRLRVERHAPMEGERRHHRAGARARAAR